MGGQSEPVCSHFSSVITVHVSLGGPAGTDVERRVGGYVVRNASLDTDSMVASEDIRSMTETDGFPGQEKNDQDERMRELAEEHIKEELESLQRPDAKAQQREEDQVTVEQEIRRKQ